MRLPYFARCETIGPVTVAGSDAALELGIPLGEERLGLRGESQEGDSRIGIDLASHRRRVEKVDRLEDPVGHVPSLLIRLAIHVDESEGNVGIDHHLEARDEPIGLFPG